MRSLGKALFLVSICALLGSCSRENTANSTPNTSPKSDPGDTEDDSARAAAQEPASPPDAVKAWDFAKLPPEQWEWRFPGGAPTQKPTGACYEVTHGGRGPWLAEQKIEAAQVATLKVTLKVALNASDNRVVDVSPDKVIFYFARSSDTGPQPNWPFDGKRAVELKCRSRRIGEFTATLTGWPGWDGIITNAFIAVYLPPFPDDEIEKGGHYSIVFSDIDFLGPTPAPAPNAAKTTDKPKTPETRKPDEKAKIAVPTVPLVPVKTWDFPALDPKDWQWQFPGGSTTKTSTGASYITDKSAPGPTLRECSIDATACTHIRVILRLSLDERGKTATAVPKKLSLYYNGPAHKSPNADWPFDNGRVVTLEAVKGVTGTYEAALAGCPQWEGVLSDFFINVEVPPLSQQRLARGARYTVNTAKIEFFGPRQLSPAAPVPVPTETPKKEETPPLPKPEPPNQDDDIVKRWDFTTLERDQWEWKFPGGKTDKPSAAPQAAVYRTSATSQGALLRDQNIQAKDIKRIRVATKLTRTEKDGSSKDIPFERITLHFTRTDDRVKDTKWPFTNKRAVTLKPVQGQDSLYTADLSANPDWKGTIKDLGFTIGVPELKSVEVKNGAKYTITTTRIELTK